MAILCIDDDPQFCDAIATVLADAGYRTQFALTAGDGLQRARESDLAIVDIHLRGLSGEEVVRAIKTVRDIPVILTSGFAPDEGKLAARRCGAQHFLAKPFDLDELLKVVETLLCDARNEGGAAG